MIPVKMKRFKRPPQCRSRYDGGPLYAEVQDFLRRKPHFDNLERYLFNSPERLSSKKPRHLVSDSLPGCYWFVPSPNHWLESQHGVVRHSQIPWNAARSEEHTSELQSLTNLVCRLLLEKKK